MNKLERILLAGAFVAGLGLADRVYAQETIDVTETGVSDSIRNGEQKDYTEALMDAKRKAIEKAGVNVKSTTEVKNFKLKNDEIESKSEGVILPGYHVKKLGYGKDGVYRVVLTARVRNGQDNSDIQEAQKHYDIALSLLKHGNASSATFSIENAFGLYPGDNEPLQWKKTFTEIYLQAAEEEEKGENRVAVKQKYLDALLEKGDTNNWKVWAALITVTWNDEKTKEYFAKACSLDKEKTIKYILPRITDYRKDMLKITN